MLKLQLFYISLQRYRTLWNRKQGRAGIQKFNEWKNAKAVKSSENEVLQSQHGFPIECFSSISKIHCHPNVTNKVHTDLNGIVQQISILRILQSVAWRRESHGIFFIVYGVHLNGFPITSPCVAWNEICLVMRQS